MAAVSDERRPRGAAVYTLPREARSTPPHHPEAEQSVLGMLMLDNAAFVKVRGKLDRESFYLPEHRIIFPVIRDMLEAGSGVDYVTLCARLRDLGQLDDAGGPKYMRGLLDSVGTSANVHRYVEIVAEKKLARDLIAKSEALVRQFADESISARQRVEIAQQGADAIRSLTEWWLDADDNAAFKCLRLGDLDTKQVCAPAYYWDRLIPENYVTVISGHGGVGKSLVAMMIIVAMATGRPLFGVPTRRCRVALYSGEDPGQLLLHRLLWVCQMMGVEPSEIDGQVHVLDATETDPVLFGEVFVAGQRTASTTAAYGQLARYIELNSIDVLFVDNMSDTYDASEIDRAKVRAFFRALTLLRRKSRMTVVLLAHVDKGTARGDRAGAESYSGSTAVHNSARSRIFLAREKDGTLRFEHQKLNLGPKREPINLTWPEGGLPAVEEPTNGYVAALASKTAARALVRLIDEYTARGEFVSPAVNSPASAARLLCREPGYPKGHKPAEVSAMLRDAERSGLLVRETYRGADRHPRERWVVTDKGRELCCSGAGSAGSAGGAHD